MFLAFGGVRQTEKMGRKQIIKGSGAGFPPLIYYILTALFSSSQWGGFDKITYPSTTHRMGGPIGSCFSHFDGKGVGQ